MVPPVAEEVVLGFVDGGGVGLPGALELLEVWVAQVVIPSKVLHWCREMTRAKRGAELRDGAGVRLWARGSSTEAVEEVALRALALSDCGWPVNGGVHGCA
ncbi:hypothetical protein E2562_039431 [Oryza meyeriana var. granulata]|uniref:Uncharacterized protein n=1 Tax=Oryza meyeriana var. granulata TaxID=110450 RepID=A0A6G1EUR7_9ORYZ|nr:hypothetical protein E2562_039431 [Oryza meyeriana var. granulata]